MNDKKPLMDYRRVQKLQTPLLLTGALLSGVGTSVSVPLVILGIAIMLFAIVIGVLYYRCPHCGRPMTMSSAPISSATSHTRAATLLRAFRVICGVMAVVRNSVRSQVARPVRLSP